jgi:hypothetical protein
VQKPEWSEWHKQTVYTATGAKEQIAALKYRIALLEEELVRKRQEIADLREQAKKQSVECMVSRCIRKTGSGAKEPNENN